MISLGIIEKKIVYPIIPIIIAIFENFYSSKNFINIYKNHIIIFQICQSLSMCLSLIPFIIIKIKSRSNKLSKNNKSSNEDIKKKYKEEYKKKLQIKKFLFIPITGVLTFSYILINYLLFYKLDFFFSFWTFDLIFVIFFSILILKEELLRHQYFSIILIIFSGIILNIININTNMNYFKLFLNF